MRRAMMVKPAVDVATPVAFLTLTIDHTKLGSADQTDFAFPIVASDPSLKSVANGGSVVHPNHIRVATDTAGTSIIPFEKVFYDDAAGVWVGWAKGSSLSHTVDPVFYLALNDNGITTFQGNVNGTWNSNYSARYHFGDGASLSVVDSTANALDLTARGGPTAVAGPVGGAVHLAAASSQWLDVAVAAAITMGTSFTICASIKSSGDFSSYRVVISLGDTTTAQVNYLVDTEITTGKPRFYFTQGAGNYQGFNGPTPVATGTWQRFVVTYDGSQMKIYLDSSIQGTPRSQTGAPDSTGLGFPSQLMRIGAIGSAGGFFDGSIAEVALMKGFVADQNWITADANAHNSPTTFTVVS